MISIHALLAESDGSSRRFYLCHTDFYPRSPCGERQCGQCRGRRCSLYFYPRSPCGERLHNRVALIPHQQFLSTLSLRRATAFGGLQAALSGDFYPRSPCGERPPSIFRHCTTYLFLSTLSLRRATSTSERLFIPSHYFYPRSPCGERR